MLITRICNCSHSLEYRETRLRWRFGSACSLGAGCSKCAQLR